jgi:hypothetical protein
VTLASNDPALLAKLGGNVVFSDGHSLDGAIAQAKHGVDELLG